MPKIQWEDNEQEPMQTRIKVVGVGGGGCNAVNDMVEKGFSGVEFHAINTDFQSLQNCRATNTIQIGEKITSGTGAGGIPEMGEQAAREAEEILRGHLNGADMIFITAGMGGGTGTGAAPVIAEYAKEMGILVVAIVTKPFTFEGPQRMKRAQEGLRRLKEQVDSLIVIMNDKLMETVGPKTPLTEAFKVANSVLAQGIRAISDLMSKPGLINVDFRDVRTIMGETGGAVMGVGTGKGENRATEAVKKACHSPLQEKIVIDGARGVLINITGGADVTMHEINEATSLIYESADPDANIIFGVVIDEDMTDEMRVTIIATGFQEALDQGGYGQFKPGQRIFRPREDVFGSAPAEAAASDDDEEGAGDPNPIPAIQRKRQAETSATVPNLDFERDDNPLSEWDGKNEAAPGPAQHVPEEAPATDPEPSGMKRSFQDSTRKMSFQDSANREEPASTGDPFETPALQRRRKHRFFE